MLLSYNCSALSLSGGRGGDACARVYVRTYGVLPTGFPEGLDPFPRQSFSLDVPSWPPPPPPLRNSTSVARLMMAAWLLRTFRTYVQRRVYLGGTWTSLMLVQLYTWLYVKGHSSDRDAQRRQWDPAARIYGVMEGDCIRADQIVAARAGGCLTQGSCALSWPRAFHTPGPRYTNVCTTSIRTYLVRTDRHIILGRIHSPPRRRARREIIHNYCVSRTCDDTYEVRGRECSVRR
jgi:hypothetical protein